MEAYSEDSRRRNGGSAHFEDDESKYKDHFFCECEQYISIKQLSKHYGSCSPMKKKYGKLFGNIDKLITSESKDLQDWKSLEVLFKFLQGHIKMMINKEQKKPSQFKNVMRKKPAPPPNIPMEEEIIEPCKPFSLAFPNNLDENNHQYEEEKIAHQEYQMPDEKMNRCGICKKFITEHDEKSQNIAVPEWYHFFHKDCLKMSAHKQYIDTMKVSCVVWDTEIQNIYLNEFFGKDFLDDLGMELLKKQLREEGNMIECKCGNMLEVAPGQVDYKQKDEEGKVLSRQAAENMAQYRVRWNNWDLIFWSNCKADPYHLGKTCEEFAEYRGADKCRFCLDKLKKVRKKGPAAFRAVCRNAECEENMQKWCDKQLEWGHFCWGTKGEDQCLPCLDPDCVKLNPGLTLEQTADDYCMIWYMGGLSQAPSVQLDCKHIFHEECLVRVLEGKWSGPRINFEYIKCPNCKTDMSCDHKVIGKHIQSARSLHGKIREIAMKRAKHEGIDKDERLQQGPYNGDLLPYAMARLSYYMWFKCKKPYFGGLKSWENNQNQNISNFKPEELVWGSCAAESVGGGIKDCKKHGTDYIEFKCKFWCSIAQWFCWGNTHFCDDCHTRQNKGDYLTKKKLSELQKCRGARSWPLKVDHPQNGKEEYALGCAICKNMKENHKGY